MGIWGNRLGILLAAIWLILTGLVGLGVAIPAIVLNLLAIAAGVLLLLEGRVGSGRRATGRDIGRILLAVWLILTGLLPFLGNPLPSQGLIMAILAVAAGVLLLIGR